MLAKKGPGGEVALDALLERLGIASEPFTEDGARLARLAYPRFGKGVGSPAVLNYGDCLAYRHGHGLEGAPALQGRRLQQDGRHQGRILTRSMA